MDNESTSDKTPQPSIDDMSDEMKKMQSPVPEASPIRPQHPDVSNPRPQPHITRPSKPIPPPSKASTQGLKPVSSDEGDEQTAQSMADKAQKAIDQLSQKMADVAQEYAEGKINQAQFNAIYKRYHEQRMITEQLLERNPDSDAWKNVISTGHTSFLRDYFAAKILSFGIYLLEDAQKITLQGQVRLPQGQLVPIFNKLRSIVQQGHQLGPAWRELNNKNWVLIVPGRYTASVVIYSSEPAIVQRKQVVDAQRDFERANANMLHDGQFTPQQLVYPHRALLQS